jgi:hypothetical protein
MKLRKDWFPIIDHQVEYNENEYNTTRCKLLNFVKMTLQKFTTYFFIIFKNNQKVTFSTQLSSHLDKLIFEICGFTRSF